MRKVFIILLAPLFLATSCPNMVSVDMTELDKGAYSAMEEAGQQVIDNEEAYVAIWEEVHAHSIPAPRPPAVDFEEHVLVCSFMGMKPTGGYSTSVLAVGLDRQKQAQIVIQESMPGPGCLTTSALTSPYVFALIPKKGVESYEFVVNQDTITCQN